MPLAAVYKARAIYEAPYAGVELNAPNVCRRGFVEFVVNDGQRFFKGLRSALKVENGHRAAHHVAVGSFERTLQHQSIRCRRGLSRGGDQVAGAFLGERRANRKV